MNHPRMLRVLTAVTVVSLLAGCAPDETPADDPAAVISPLPSPTDEASPAPSPSPEGDASPSPSPSPSPEAAPDLDEDEALAAARARRAEREDCDTGFADEAHEVVATTDESMLVFVACFIGAYQPSGELRVWDGTSLDPLLVEQWQFGDVLETSEVVGLVTASSDGATVVNEVKYRGLGDCGLFQRWAFDGTTLELELVRELECDDEREFVPSDQWPVVYEQ